MRIGVVTEGTAEFRSLGSFLRRVLPAISIAGPTLVKASPDAAPELTAGAILRQIPTLAADEAKAIVVVIDRDEQHLCPPSYARALERLLSARCKKHGINRVKVIVKNRMFENWLISDPSAFLKFPKRYDRDVANSIKLAGNADSINAMNLLSRVCLDDYNKVVDAMILMRQLNPDTMARNSRSFRKFMKELHGLAPRRVRT